MTKQFAKCGYFAGILCPFGKGYQKFAGEYVMWANVFMYNFIPFSSGLLEFFVKMWFRKSAKLMIGILLLDSGRLHFLD